MSSFRQLQTSITLLVKKYFLMSLLQVGLKSFRLSRNPCYITPAIKAKLRRRNRLRRAGRVDEANALAQRIGKDIANRNTTRLSRINPKTCSKDLWKAIKQLTGRRENTEARCCSLPTCQLLAS